MDIVKLFEDITENFNAEQKCDMCWEFSAPLFESAINVVQTEEPCCTQLMLTNFRYIGQNTYASSGLMTNTMRDYSFNLHVLKKTNHEGLGTNNHNEIKGHPVSESKWATVYKPLFDCLNDSEALALCEMLGFNVEIAKWEMSLVRNYQDDNYDGWLINAIIRTRNE